MAWDEKYSDMLSQLYWSLGYLGLQSIDRTSCQVDDTTYHLPIEQLAKGSTFYRRIISEQETLERAKRLEEPLNHVLDIAFSIAPDEMIQRTLGDPLGIDLGTGITSLGREVRLRYEAPCPMEFIQQDGFFISPRAAIALEIKTGAPSSASQIAKYALLLALEEEHSGPRGALGLLYIAPKIDTAFWRTCGLSNPDDASASREEIAAAAPAILPSLPLHVQERFHDVLGRMKIAGVSWSFFQNTLRDLQMGLDQNTPGEQTLWRLIEGVCSAISAHERTNT